MDIVATQGLCEESSFSGDKNQDVYNVYSMVRCIIAADDLGTTHVFAIWRPRCLVNRALVGRCVELCSACDTPDTDIGARLLAFYGQTAAVR